MTSDKEARAVMKRWSADPLGFAVQVCKFHPDDWQVDAFRMLADPNKQRLCCKAAKGCGKTAWEAVANWWFLATKDHPKMAATSITGDNLSDNLWPEMAKWMHNSEFLKRSFVWTKTRIFNKLDPEFWFFSARNWPKSGDANAQADALAGIHGDYTLFTFDEAGGIPEAVLATAEATMATGIENRLLILGNPTHTSGPLWSACKKERHLWNVLEITGDPDDPKRSTRISKKWAREQVEKYGRENSWVKVNVYGEFPEVSLDTLIGPEEVRSAIGRAPENEIESVNKFQKRLGVDVARFGDDQTVIFPRQGAVAFAPTDLRHERNFTIAQKIVEIKNSWYSEMEFIDDTGGYGGGVIDDMIHTGYAPVGINFSSTPIDRRYANKRAEMWFEMCRWIKGGGCLPDIPELVPELSSPTYTINRQGRLQLQEKSQIKSAIGRSPDYADALALTFALPEMRSEFMQGIRLQGKNTLKSEYDPLSDDSD